MIHGIPSIPVPHVLDQKGFTMQLYNIIVATKPLKSKDLHETTIYEVILDMQRTYEEQRTKNVELLSAKIKKEKGLEKAVRVIEQLLEM